MNLAQSLASSSTARTVVIVDSFVGFLSVALSVVARAIWILIPRFFVLA